MMKAGQDRVQVPAELLHEAAEAHHVAYKETDGVDPDWSIWYADYLLAHGIDKLLEAKLLKSDLIYLLVRADKEQVAEAPGGNWERYYADFLLRRYLK
jgi:hypothetical protein